MMDRSSRVYVAGHRGLVGSALVRALEARGVTPIVRTRAELDLTDGAAVSAFLDDARPELLFMAAAKVGGIAANDAYPADFIRENLEIQTNLISGAHRVGAERVLFLGSSCVYPKHAPQPICEDALLTGPLEPTNRPYALAKIAGIEMLDAYRRQYGLVGTSLMPSNLYGPGDNYDLSSSHVLAAILRKMIEARDAGAPSVELWGTGAARREFLYVDDLAEAALLLMAHPSPPPLVNVGVGRDITIRELADLIRDIIGYRGSIVWDHRRPDGTPRKLLDTRILTGLGFVPRVSLRAGIERAAADFSATRGARGAR